MTQRFDRLITGAIKRDLEKKIVLLSGPRQVGKTTLAKSLETSFEYFNYDSAEDRIALLQKSWDRSKSLLIFDEIHKMKNWKSWIKGVYDKEGARPRLMITGSARLDLARKMGDSLAGRYFSHRLHPLDIKELREACPPEETYRRLLGCSGFPEPFFEGTEVFYQRWRKTHLDIILRQDLIDLEKPREIAAIETLFALLQRRVGSTVSYASLARDLERDPKTIQRWLVALENLFVIFRVTPYHRNIARSLLKEPKFYFYDVARVIGDEGQKLENLVALALRKEMDLLGDTRGLDGSLHFLKTKDGREIDFFVLIGREDPILVEVKLGDGEPHPHFAHFSKYVKRARKIQLVKNIKRDRTFPDGLEIRQAIPWLAKVPLVIP